MALRTKLVKSGGWRTLEWFWRAPTTGHFIAPAGAHIKVRWGLGWLGWNSQSQTLDGHNTKSLNVSNSYVWARWQMKVERDANVTYDYIPVGP